MKIYTKTGDGGNTSLLGGERVPKYDLRIDAYGGTDELNSYLGYLGTIEELKAARGLISEIQHQLFVCGSHLATNPANTKVKLPAFDEELINKLEQHIDELNELLPELKNFVLPGGSKENAMAHIARCVCRRAERTVVQLGAESEVHPFIPVFLNRLSDWLFILSRYILQLQKLPEVLWTTR